jgi:hypothetical protein
MRHLLHPKTIHCYQESARRVHLKLRPLADLNWDKR